MLGGDGATLLGTPLLTTPALSTIPENQVRVRRWSTLRAWLVLKVHEPLCRTLKRAALQCEHAISDSHVPRVRAYMQEQGSRAICGCWPWSPKEKDCAGSEAPPTWTKSPPSPSLRCRLG